MPSNTYLFTAKQAVMPGKWERFVVLTDADHVAAWNSVKMQHPTLLDEGGYSISHLGTLPASLPGTTVQCHQSAPVVLRQGGSKESGDSETF